LISNAEESLLALETDPEDMDAVGSVFRAFHTVKGTSAFLELILISELGHHAESLLSRVRDGEIRYSGGYADLSLRALDMIKELIAAVQDALAGNPLLKPDGYSELLSVLKDPEAAGVSAETDDIAAPRVGDILVAQGKADRRDVESAAVTHPEEKMGVAIVKTGTASVKDVGQALRTQKRMRSSGQVVESSVRVSTHRLDRLIDMVGELVIAHSMVAQDTRVFNANNHDLAKKVSHTTKIVRELQDISMSMRMVPMKATFNKMARLVRDVARKVGKNVNFVTEGEETEIDRNLVDVINDPLVHMVRNSVDHGIESPEERKANGKSETGVVQLSAYHSAGSVVVEIKDDGKGLNREGIIAKAKERGLVSDAPDFDERSLSDREVNNMIFEAGFSTAEEITDVSGRGVGMDVVKKNIESLRGQVEIKSEPGKGSVFKMSLPLTLAIIDGMVVRVGHETYVIPTVSILRSIKANQDAISTVLGRGEMVSLQGNLIPLYRLAGLYNITGAKEELTDAIIVVVEDEDRQAGLVVDELLGRQQVVIKTLGETMKEIPGISGGAIMPDGRVGLILDVGGLVRFANLGQDEGFSNESESGKAGSLAA
jgi:two-component system chemotaxis sensor kinase CheA